MSVIWYCDNCDEILPLGLWDKIPVHDEDMDSRLVQLLCPKCKNSTFYCMMEKRLSDATDKEAI